MAVGLSSLELSDEDLINDLNADCSLALRKAYDLGASNRAKEIETSHNLLLNRLREAYIADRTLGISSPTTNLELDFAIRLLLGISKT